MAKKTDKALRDLAKEVKKLRKENEKLTKSFEKTYEDQAAAHRELRNLLEERLPAGGTGTGEAEEHSHDEDGGFVTAETAAESDDISEASAEARQDQKEEPEVTDAAKRRAEELGIDPTSVEGTGSGGRVLVKDVEASAGQ